MPEKPPVQSPSALAAALRLVDGAATLEKGWFSWAGPQGGLVSALCLRAAEPLFGDERVPRSLTVLLLEPAGEGELHFDASPVRRGGSSTVIAVEGAAGGDPVVRATVVAGRSRGASTLSVVPAPDVPRAEDCPDLVLPVEFVPFSQHLHFRSATSARPLDGGADAELVAWVRFADVTPLDAEALTVLVDAMPPALYGATATPVAVPTVELNVLFTEAPPADGWVLLRIATREAAGGWCVDDSEVWDGEGRLLAQARQTRRVLGEWQEPR